MRFQNKTVLITGGNSGIGKACALAFAAEGARIIVCDIAAAMDAELQSALDAYGANPLFYTTDVADRAAVDRLFENALQQCDAIDVLVNSAGVGGPRARTEAYEEADFDRVMDINVKGTLFAMQCALRHFMERKSGAIVNISSMAGHIVMGGQIAYAASKHAVIGMTKTAGLEFARYGIRVNAVCPAFTHTPLFDDLSAENIAFKEALRQATPMRRFGRPEEIARVILFLASEEASYMAGACVQVDGGLGLQ